jgi:hypothetical protein
MTAWLGSSRNHYVHASEEPRAIAACGHAEGAQDRAELRIFHEFDMLELGWLSQSSHPARYRSLETRAWLDDKCSQKLKWGRLLFSLNHFDQIV